MKEPQRVEELCVEDKDGRIWRKGPYDWYWEEPETVDGKQVVYKYSTSWKFLERFFGPLEEVSGR